jgi:epoxyqueuosine reductase
MDGKLTYMRQHVEVRTDPRHLLAGARSVLMVAKSYLRVDEGGRPIRGPVSAHAAGRDYHTIMKKGLWEVGRLVTQAGGRFKLFVDSAPVMEKVLAAAAGLGKIGRNSLLVHPVLGSWVVLGGLVTDLDLTPRSGRPEGPGPSSVAQDRWLSGTCQDDHPDILLPDCRGCRRCVEACPAQAISEGGVVDAGRCLSYWTIEHSEGWPDWVAERVGEQMYGCDLCQQVCPVNQGARATGGTDFGPFPFDGLDAVDLAGWDATRFRNRTRKSSMRRIRFEQFRRNASACARNRKLKTDSD